MEANAVYTKREITQNNILRQSLGTESQFLLTAQEAPEATFRLTMILYRLVSKWRNPPKWVVSF